jgi:hypothetical protein
MKCAIRIPRLAGVLSWLLLTFLVMLPKGGIKPGGVPLTWGYGLLAFLFLPLLVVRLLVYPLRASPVAVAVFASLAPFPFFLFYSLYANGQESIAITGALIAGFVFLPAIFLGVFPPFLRFVDFERFRRYFCFCILAAALWGIFLFFYHPIMGHYIEIPYLTVNAGDYGQLENTKNLARGGYLKLIATYNNGNLYGVATLILLPLYLYLEPAKWKRNVIRIALILTLSRTVWAGLILEQLLSLAAKLPHVVARFPRIRPRRAAPQLIAVVATSCLILPGLFFSGHGAGFLFDSSLGGRAGEATGFLSSTLLPSTQVGPFEELFYASALRLYGVLGLLAIVLIFATPVFILVWKPWLVRIPTRRAAAKGLILYALIANIDAAALLIPVMAFYFFAYMVFLHGMPGEPGLALAPEPEPSSPRSISLPLQ